jgi:hypothetical protein
MEDDSSRCPAHAKRRCELGRTESEVGDESQGGGVALGQPGEAVPDLVSELAELDELGRRHLGRRRPLAVPGVERHLRVRRCPPPVVDRGVSRNLKEPRAEASRLFQRGEMLQRTREGLLDEVELRVRIGDGVPNGKPHGRRMPAEEPGEALGLAAPHLGDEIRIVAHRWIVNGPQICGNRTTSR